ncbi:MULTISPECIES: DUF1116 domain-containing protein [unclassified Bradyrhizobium]|uniref:DUF1116 domain-containing protein n=1 Tax=unclassified Bradyrhizobium TaxID=2631580 RepID=UPI0028E8F63A|nr:MULTISPECIES: DUF1116 domain-containing protein [unclassified Bradyrhizobium]
MSEHDPAAIARPAETSLHPADRAALVRMHAVRPVWRGVASAQDVIAFPDRTILHAGPPVRSGAIAAPILNSTVMAILFEGWAKDETAARAMLTHGEVQLAPAQDVGAMVPLAAVLSPNMAVQIVADAADAANTTYSPLNGGIALAQRLGLCSREVLTHLRWMNGNLAATLEIVVDNDIPLIEIADSALMEGDDCHSRTSAATRRLIERIAPRLGGDTPERRFLDRASAFFLNLWMAAVKCIANAGVGEGSSIITALGGNGVDCGIKLGGSGEHWFVAPAEPPEGNLLPGFQSSDRLGAIGDSALVDAAGFGAMTAVSLPQARGPASDREDMLPAVHRGFKRSGIKVGTVARALVRGGTPLDIVLGILDCNGHNGRIGGGIYRPPLYPFTAAVASLAPTTLPAQGI